MYGQSQYYDKLVCRNADFTALVSVIIKASEAYATTSEHVRFSDFFKQHASELTMAEAMRKAICDTPAQSSKCAN